MSHDCEGNLATLIPLNQTPPIAHYYTAFGEESNPTVSPWRYRSKRTDPLSNLVYFGRRFYLPSFCRWLTPDPKGFHDGMNLYAYTHNTSLNRAELSHSS